MNYFYEILDHFNSINNKRILLKEQAQSNVVWSYKKEKGFAIGVRSVEGRKKLSALGYKKDTSLSNLESQAGPDSQNRKAVQTPTGKTIYVWLAQDKNSSAQAPKTSDTKNKETDSKDKQSTPPAEGSVDKNKKPLVALPPPLSTTFFDTNLAASFLQFANPKAIIKIFNKSLVDQNRARTNLERRYIEILNSPDLTDKIFGMKRYSIHDRMLSCRFLTLDPKTGEVDSPEVDFTAEERAIEIRETFSEIFRILSKDPKTEQLTQKEVDYLNKRIGIQGGGDHTRFIIDSPDGTFRMSMGRSGSVAALSHLMLYQMKKLTERTEFPIKDFKRIRLSGDFSSALGSLVEKLSVNRLRAASLERKLSRCEEKNNCPVLTAQQSIVSQEYTQIISSLKDRCARLATLINSEDVAGDPEAVQHLEELRNQLNTILTGQKVDDEKILKLASFANKMIESRKVISTADWSVVTGEKRGAGRKPDILSVFFDEQGKSQAELASKETKESYESYPYDSPQVAGLFKDGSSDPEYASFLAICRAEGVKEVHIIKPSLKATTSDRGEIKGGTSNGENYEMAADHIIADSEQGDAEYSGKFTEMYRTNMGELYSYEAKQGRETFYAQMRELGFDNKDEIKEAVKWAKKDAEILRIVKDTSLTAITKTLQGKEISVNQFESMIDLMSEHPIVKNLEMSKSNIRDALQSDTGLLQDLFNNLSNARAHATATPPNESLAKQAFLKSIQVIQHANIQSQLKSKNDSVRRKAILRLATEIQLKGGASKLDQSVLYFNFKQNKSSVFTHNACISNVLKDLISNQGKFTFSDSGYSISGPNGRLAMRSNFAGNSKGGSHEIRFDGRSIESATVPETETFMEQELTQDKNSNLYQQGMLLIEQFLETQKKLMISMLPKPEIISGDRK